MLKCVKSLNVFETLTQKEIDEIAAHAEVIELKKGNILFGPEDKVEHIYILHQGRIKIYKLNEAGKQLTLDYLTPGNIIGEVDIFTLRPRGVFAEVTEKSLLCKIDKHYIKEIMNSYPEFTRKIMELVCRRVKDLENDFYDQALCSKKGQVIRKLIKMADEKRFDQKEVTVNITHQELADLIGAARETVSLILKDLSREGFIVTAQKKITFDKYELQKHGEEVC